MAVDNGLESDLDFYLKFAKPLVFSLPEHTDRINAAAWIQKLRDPESGDKQLRTDYLKILLFVLQKKKLLGIFKDPPNEEKLNDLDDKFKDLGNLAKEFLNIEDKEGVENIPRIITDFSVNLQEYAAYQEIPKFGVHAFYAFSTEPLFNWYHMEKGKYVLGNTSSKNQRSSSKETCRIPIVAADNQEIQLENLPNPTWGSVSKKTLYMLSSKWQEKYKDDDDSFPQFDPDIINEIDDDEFFDNLYGMVKDFSLDSSSELSPDLTSNTPPIIGDNLQKPIFASSPISPNNNLNRDGGLSSSLLFNESSIAPKGTGQVQNVNKIMKKWIKKYKDDDSFPQMEEGMIDDMANMSSDDDYYNDLQNMINEYSLDTSSDISPVLDPANSPRLMDDTWEPRFPYKQSITPPQQDLIIDRSIPRENIPSPLFGGARDNQRLSPRRSHRKKAVKNAFKKWLNKSNGQTDRPTMVDDLENLSVEDDTYYDNVYEMIQDFSLDSTRSETSPGRGGVRVDNQRLSPRRSDQKKAVKKALKKWLNNSNGQTDRPSMVDDLENLSVEDDTYYDNVHGMIKDFSLDSTRSETSPDRGSARVNNQRLSPRRSDQKKAVKITLKKWLNNSNGQTDRPSMVHDLENLSVEDDTYYDNVHGMIKGFSLDSTRSETSPDRGSAPVDNQRLSPRRSDQKKEVKITLKKWLNNSNGQTDRPSMVDDLENLSVEDDSYYDNVHGMIKDFSLDSTRSETSPDRGSAPVDNQRLSPRRSDQKKAVKIVLKKWLNNSNGQTDRPSMVDDLENMSLEDDTYYDNVHDMIKDFSLDSTRSETSPARGSAPVDNQRLSPQRSEQKKAVKKALKKWLNNSNRQMQDDLENLSVEDDSYYDNMYDMIQDFSLDSSRSETSPDRGSARVDNQRLSPRRSDQKQAVKIAFKKWLNKSNGQTDHPLMEDELQNLSVEDDTYYDNVYGMIQDFSLDSSGSVTSPNTQFASMHTSPIRSPRNVRYISPSARPDLLTDEPIPQGLHPPIFDPRINQMYLMENRSHPIRRPGSPRGYNYNMSPSARPDLLTDEPIPQGLQPPLSQLQGYQRIDRSGNYGYNYNMSPSARPDLLTDDPVPQGLQPPLSQLQGFQIIERPGNYGYNYNMSPSARPDLLTDGPIPHGLHSPLYHSYMVGQYRG